MVVGALLYYWHSTFYEDTDDAQVSGHIIQISARIQGHIINVPVKENQEVAAGTLIAEIDPHDYEVLVAQDEANLEAAEAAYEAAKVNVPVTNTQSFSSLSSAGANVLGSNAQVRRAMQLLEQAQAEVAQAEANNTKSQLDLKRCTPLVEKDVISKQQYDQAVAAAQANEAGLASAKANVLRRRTRSRWRSSNWRSPRQSSAMRALDRSWWPYRRRRPTRPRRRWSRRARN